MKRIVVLSLLVLLSAAGNASAQRCLPGQWAIELAGGSVDGFILSDEHAAHSIFGRIVLNRYNHNQTRWAFGLGYLQKDYPYKTVNLPMAQFTGEVGYVVPLFSNRKRSLVCSSGLSAAGGYETTG